MTDVGLGELLVRMVVSLAVVLGLVFGAYALIRRRQGLPSGRQLRGLTGGVAGGSTKRSGLVRSKSSASGAKRGLRIVGRVATGRTSSIIAVQFADRVFMVGASETSSPNVLAELDLDSWTRSTEASEDLLPVARGGAGPIDPGTTDRRPSFVDALREVTTRRG